MAASPGAEPATKSWWKLLDRSFATGGFESAVAALARARLARLEAKAARGEYAPAMEFVRLHLRLGNREPSFRMARQGGRRAHLDAVARRRPTRPSIRCAAIRGSRRLLDRVGHPGGRSARAWQGAGALTAAGGSAGSGSHDRSCVAGSSGCPSSRSPSASSRRRSWSTSGGSPIRAASAFRSSSSSRGWASWRSRARRPRSPCCSPPRRSRRAASGAASALSRWPSGSGTWSTTRDSRS